MQMLLTLILGPLGARVFTWIWPTGLLRILLLHTGPWTVSLLALSVGLIVISSTHLSLRVVYKIITTSAHVMIKIFCMMCTLLISAFRGIRAAWHAHAQ